jgi:hypothetical protein
LGNTILPKIIIFLKELLMESTEPIVQKKRSITPEHREAVIREVKKIGTCMHTQGGTLSDTGGNPVMVKKTDKVLANVH